MSTKKILITGSSGQVGTALKSIELPDFTECLYATRSICDITDRTSLEKIKESFNPDYIVNCAAYTAVDRAEEDEKETFLVNADALKLIADTFAEAKIIHLSSDYVYHALQGPAIKESDDTLPQGIYAQSKLDGEKILRASHMASLIIRTSWVYHHSGHNFVKTILRLGDVKEELTIVDDQRGSPTYATDIADLIMLIIRKDIQGEITEEQWNDTYNFSNLGKITWYELAVAIKEISGFKARLTPVSTAFYGSPAPRPPYSVLDMSKVVDTFGVSVTPWLTSLDRCYKEIQKIHSTDNN